MTADLNPIQPGDPIPTSARTINAMLAAARAHQAATQQPGDTLPGGSNAVVTIKNNSGSDVPRLGVLGLDGPLFTPTDDLEGFKRGVVFKGVAPVTGTHEGNFVVCLDPIAAGKFGRAVISGLVQVQVDFASENDDGCEVIGADTAKLGGRIASGFARVIWKEPGVGTKWAIVELGIPIFRPFAAKIDARAAMGSSDSRWVYTITQVNLDITASGGTISAVSRTNTTGGVTDAKAINLAETENAGNTGVAFGVDRAGSAYPSAATFGPRPIGGGGADDTLKEQSTVWVVGRVIASDGTPVYLFDRMGTHDGPCE